MFIQSKTYKQILKKQPQLSCLFFFLKGESHPSGAEVIKASLCSISPATQHKRNKARAVISMSANSPSHAPI